MEIVLLSYLDPCKEDSNSNGVVELTLPESQEFKVSILLWVLK